MEKFFNIDAPIFRFMTRVGELMIFSVLWILCSLPVVTVGAATAALYHMMFRMNQDGSTKISDYFRAFAQNFKRGTLLWLAAILMVAFLALFYYLIAWIENDIVRLVLLAVFGILFVMAFIVAVYIFPLTAYFDNTVLNTIRNAVGMGAGHLRQSIPACALCIVPVLVMILLPEIFIRLLFLVPLLVPGAVAYGIASLLLPVFEHYSQPEEIAE